ARRRGPSRRRRAAASRRAGWTGSLHVSHSDENANRPRTQQAYPKSSKPLTHFYSERTMPTHPSDSSCRPSPSRHTTAPAASGSARRAPVAVGRDVHTARARGAAEAAGTVLGMVVGLTTCVFVFDLLHSFTQRPARIAYGMVGA